VTFTLFVSLLLLATPAPADGLGLAPGGGPLPRPGPALPVSLPAGALGLGGVGAGMAVLIAARGGARGRRDDEPFFVFVPGHGGAPEDFDDLVERMGLDRDHVAAFDYRWVWTDADPREAARWAHTSDAAGALHAYLEALAAEHSEIYVVAHSKGGAVVTEMVSRWDREPTIAVDHVTGAALLDPAISAGILGTVQQLGYVIGPLADNGLFHPVRCEWFSCSDIRDHLGERSGVEVIAVRNPDALITNFRDEPEGMRIYELDDGGPHPLSWPWDPVETLDRIGEAHGAVLHSDVVADCIVAEAGQTGSCTWPQPDPVFTRPRAGGGFGGGAGVRAM